MSDVTLAFQKLTLQDADIAQLVGPRMFTDFIPQGFDVPAITYWTIDTQANNHLLAAVPLSQARIQVDCFDDTRAKSIKLADLVRLQVESFRGDVDMGDGSFQFINEITVSIGQRHEYDRDLAGSNTRRFNCSLDYLVSYRETIGV